MARKRSNPEGPLESAVPTKSEPADQCSICQSGAGAEVLPCRHRFHLACLRRLADKRCPNCRAPFASADVEDKHMRAALLRLPCLAAVDFMDLSHGRAIRWRGAALKRTFWGMGSQIDVVFLSFVKDDQVLEVAADRLSIAGDELHCFVHTYMGGCWPCSATKLSLSLRDGGVVRGVLSSIQLRCGQFCLSLRAPDGDTAHFLSDIVSAERLSDLSSETRLRLKLSMEPQDLFVVATTRATAVTTLQVSGSRVILASCGTELDVCEILWAKGPVYPLSLQQVKEKYRHAIEILRPGQPVQISNSEWEDPIVGRALCACWFEGSPMLVVVERSYSMLCCQSAREAHWEPLNSEDIEISVFPGPVISGRSILELPTPPTFIGSLP